MTTTYDAIVIGGGINGLVAATQLGKARRRVLLLEARSTLGGTGATREFHPGYRSPGILHDTRALRVELCDALGLLSGENALRFRGTAPAAMLLTADGRGLRISSDVAATTASIATFSKRDAEAYPEFRAFVDRAVRPLRTVLTHAAPDIATIESFASQWQLAMAALKVRMLGRSDMLRLMRALPMTIRDFLDDHFETPAVKAALIDSALLPVWGGPWSAATTATWMLHQAALGPGTEGGPGRVVAALESACKRNNVEVRTGTSVTRIRVKNSMVLGVTTAGGEDIDASVVLSSCDPKRTFLDLVEPCELALEIEDQARPWRTRGIVAKVHLALNAPLKGRGGSERVSHFQVGDSLEYIERAFDAVKYGEFASAPHLDVCVATVEDAALAPAGHEVLSVLVRCAPHDLDGGWTDAARAKLGDTVVRTLATVCPGIESTVVAREVLTPLDIDLEFGLSGGHLFHGEYALDQLMFFRPSPALARHTTPIDGLVLCGSGTHPGGAVTGFPGWLAANAAKRLR